MVESDDYEFLVALDGHDVQAFSIVKRFSDADGCLLEYMAVERPLRGRGVGGRLFRAACTTPAIVTRHVLLEVESEGEEGLERTVRARRKAFYRALGCREVSGLAYLMPSVAVSRPPPMNVARFPDMACSLFSGMGDEDHSTRGTLVGVALVMNPAAAR